MKQVWAIIGVGVMLGGMMLVSFANLRTEMRTEIASLRTEIASLRTEIDNLRAEMRTEFKTIEGRLSHIEGRLRSTTLHSHGGDEPRK